MTDRNKSRPDTKELIADAFKEIAETTPIEKITILEITDKAGVIRPTFYNHFEDKYDLLKWIMEKELIKPVIPLFEGGFIYEGLTILFTNALKNKQFYLQAAKLDGAESFEKIINKMVKDQLESYIMNNVPEGTFVKKWFGAKDIAEYYANSICFVAMKWLKSGMTLSPSEVAGVYKVIITNSLESLLHEFEQSGDYLPSNHYIKI